MPRKVHGPETLRSRRPSRLAEELAKELKSGRESGQPMIDEEHFKTGSIRINVLWDRWEDVDPEGRSAAIIEAYRIVEGEEFAGRIALVNGLTIPEAIGSGMLPVKIIAALRENDPVTPDECRQAMIEQGASTLFPSGDPEMRFATEEEAEEGRRRLAARLPGSGPAWVIVKEPNFASRYDWDYPK